MNVMDKGNKVIAKNKKLETLIYIGLWVLAIVLGLFDIMRARSYTDMPLLDPGSIFRMMVDMLPFMALFGLNNYLMIPRLLKNGRYGQYFIAAVVLVVVVWIWQMIQFKWESLVYGIPDFPGLPRNCPQPLLPLPLFLDVIYDVLIIGVNLAISLVFQHFDDRIEQEHLMKQNVESQLTYLKAQINPHFYMNMLNNIHGMIEINPGKAQDMVIEMSGLMRYMLYDSSRSEINLSSEVSFIRNYFGLMRERYPEDVVAISVNLPEDRETAAIKVPPLIFLVFIENAFKHGVSYSKESFITVDLIIKKDNIMFQCTNSVGNPDRTRTHEGIGLENVRRRMDIIYGECYTLDIDSDNNVYSITLSLPYEVKNTNN